MANIKENNLIGITVNKIVYVPGQNTYDISSEIDASDVNTKFLWRTPQHIYTEIPGGSFTVRTADNVKQLILQSTIDDLESIQIIKLVHIESKKFPIKDDIDVNMLAEYYNELKSDLDYIFDSFKKTGMKTDSSDAITTFPDLKAGEVFLRTVDGYRGFNIGDIEANINDFWVAFNSKTSAIIKTITDESTKAKDDIKKVSGEESVKISDLGAEQKKSLVTQTDDAKLLLDMIWRMYSITTGSNKFLDGATLGNRAILKLDRTADGGILEDRIGEPRWLYDGGTLESRVIKIPLNIDLGGV